MKIPVASGPVSVPLDSTYHRIREWLSLEGTSGDWLSNSPLKQDYLKQVAQNHLQMAFNIFKSRDFMTSLGNLC